MKTKVYAALSADKPLQLFEIERRAPRETEVMIEILYCGVCHSDLHQARNEWHNTKYPCVPGHEIVGKVVQAGAQVKKFKIGDVAAIGCMVDSCGQCDACKENLEQHCKKTATFTYNSKDRKTGENTLGGYSQRIVAEESFVLRVPENLDLAAAAPLLCAGITTYSPLKRFKVGKGQKVGVIGLGGLGHMAVKFAKAFGAHVVVFSRSHSKEPDAKRLGADEVIISTDKAEMQKHAGSFDFILDTVAADHDINAYMEILKREASLCLVGAPENPLAVEAFSLIFQRRNLAGSLIGGIQETQEMLDFCGKNKITSDIELIKIDEINQAYERLLKSDVKYRFVIDMQHLK
ncbi:MAG: NAD(P)-dependent alcohol dehydrogenase [Candidatus Omnitrophica bacterium]|nr:NAD(P)-dependent alcohol dehydrogenase [Candidatus Omnitrophota bacterium]